MGRTARDRRDLPHPKPVERISLSEKHLSVRGAVVLLLLALALGALLYALTQLLSDDPGWREISASGAQPTCAGEFTLRYDVGRTGAAASADYKQVAACWTQACAEAYRIFSADERFDGMGNLALLNGSPNTPVQVEPALLAALRLLNEKGGRVLFLAPVYDQYRTLFGCQNDAEALQFDPYRNADFAALLAELTSFTSDPEAVSLQFSADGAVTLCVSQEYLSYARENGITRFLDFYWLKNAFITDYLAEKLTERGFVYGTVDSVDGFTANLDPRGTAVAVTLTHRSGVNVSTAGTVTFDRPLRLVRFRDYPMGETDRLYRYVFADGQARACYIDPADGLCRAALPELLCASETQSCAELALRGFAACCATEFDPAALTDMDAAWTDGTVHLTGSLLKTAE